MYIAATAMDAFVRSYEKIKDSLMDFFMDADMWQSILGVCVKIIIMIIVSRVIIRVLHTTINHTVIDKDATRLRLDSRRTRTIGKLINNVVSYTINFITFLLVLSQFNLDLAPLLAGAGVLGLAIGFGAQSLVKDVISGFFIIAEDQFAVGDVIQVNNFKGVVEVIGLRITRIKNWTGEVRMIPNGSIIEVTNFSMYNAVAVIDLTVNVQADFNQVSQTIQDTVKEVYESNSNMVTMPSVFGIQKLSPDTVGYRIVAECKLDTQAAVERDLNTRIRLALQQNDENALV